MTKMVYAYLLERLYRVSREKKSILWDLILSVIEKKQVRMDMRLILNGYRHGAL